MILPNSIGEYDALAKAVAATDSASFHHSETSNDVVRGAA
jgi:hypothetical protein